MNFDINERMGLLRRVLNLSQTDLADATGRTQASINMLEKGACQLTSEDVLSDLAHSLQTTAYKLTQEITPHHNALIQKTIIKIINSDEQTLQTIIKRLST